MWLSAAQEFANDLYVQYVQQHIQHALCGLREEAQSMMIKPITTILVIYTKKNF
jgi:hypothetical protein